ncbi:MAG: type II and III secretion system protein family protein [Proteobacteria bacterium]|nr:type II and III secretion system protein family protein [Pseudomonadota bacterium]
MNMTSIATSLATICRRAGSCLALSASFSFGFQPVLVLAQSPNGKPAAEGPSKPKGHAKAGAKKASRHMPSDTVSDDLNRREAERAAQMVRQLTSAPSPAAGTAASAGKATALPAAAVAQIVPTSAKIPEPAAMAAPAVESEPPTVAAIPPRPPIVSASLTPDVGAGSADPSSPASIGQGVVTPPVPSKVVPLTPGQMVQMQKPAPVPIQPPAVAPAGPPAVTGAPGRAFGQSQMVSPQQPTLRLEVNKGTAIKLPGPATTVFVAAPDIADVQVKTPGMIYVFAKKPGDTVLYAVDDQDRVLLNTIVSVTSPLSRIKEALDALHPANGVTFDNQGETIVLGGTVRSAVVAEDARRLALQYVNNVPSKVVNNIRIDAPTQVQLQVKVAEVDRNSLKRVGINWQNINNIALFGLGPITAGFATSTITAVGGPVPGSAQVVAQSSNGALTSLVDFLATQNQATILAEPNLIAMSGETASFLAGGEIPVVTPQGGLNNTLTVMYKQIGISLNFTPTIIGDRINLKVAPEVSQVTTNGQVSVAISSTASIVIPAIQTRRASTTVELGSGQSFAIAGLMQRTSKQDIQKMPWLGDIPVLGALFKSDAYQREETELVIIVTPYFVEPVNGKLRTPLTGRVPPTDVDRLVYGRFNNPTPPQRLSVGQQVSGASAGFKLN